MHVVSMDCRKNCRLLLPKMKEIMNLFIFFFPYKTNCIYRCISLCSTAYASMKQIRLENLKATGRDSNTFHKGSYLISKASISFLK